MSGRQDPSSRLVTGVSYVSFPTSDEKLYRDSIAFYSMLGLNIVQEYDRNLPESSIGVKTVSAHASNSVKETWMCSQGDNVSGATIKLRLTEDSGVTAEEAAAQVNKLCEKFSNGDWRAISSALVFQVDEVRKAIECLPKNRVECIPTDQAPVEGYAVDPLGNVVGFTTKPNPFSSKESPEVSTSSLGQFVSSEDAASAVDSAISRSPSVSGSDIYKKKRIAIMTSGGDAPGMNGAVRAVVRAAIHRGCDAYAVYEGYEGLVKGGNYIKQMSWDDVRGYLSIGGTKIGTARCKEFRERSGRLQAAHNFIKCGIDALIVCGGDGSLTGADRFRDEWESLVKELVDTGTCTKEQIAGHEHLHICGLVGSIDNDMASTDATIGAYSSLDRICQSVDYIDATAQSHSRAFVVEVMGRHCGWLALMAGLATNADYVFLPEQPPKPNVWADEMCKIVARHREKGMRKTIVIVAEGAIDSDLNHISSDEVKDVLVDRLGLDTRVTTLGHIQRGGPAVAFDRLLATLQGVEAVDAVLTATPDTPTPMIGITENKVVRRDLMEAVKLTGSVAEAIKAKNFSKAINLRDTEFHEHLTNFNAINEADTERPLNPAQKQLRMAIITVGAPAGGMNSAVRAAACYCFSRGHKPFAIHNGFTGLARHESVREINWLEAEDWASMGGCEIGTNRNTPDTDFGMIAYYFQKYAFDGLIIVGGFEAYVSLHQLEQARSSYPAFRIPMVCLPATISNNVPGTEYSLGTDTCLNALVTYCDVVKQSASSTRRRVFVVEVQGGNSGYVAAYAGLVTGAHVVYTPEEGISFKQLGSDIEYLKDQFMRDQGRNRAGRLVLRNEKASKTFRTDTLVSILRNEADGKFEAREAIPGHVQQGGTPSPMDRVRSVRLAVKCVEHLENMQELRPKPVPEQDEMFAVIGVRSSKLVFTPISTLWDYETEVDTRRPNKIHWNGLIKIADMLVGRPKVTK
jgi:6-phosphofructokinase 1